MTTINESAPVSAGQAATPTVHHRILGALTFLGQTWVAHRQFRVTVEILSAMNDRQLADIGVARADIVRRAYEQAYGRPMR